MTEVVAALESAGMIPVKSVVGTVDVLTTGASLAMIVLVTGIDAMVMTVVLVFVLNDGIDLSFRVFVASMSLHVHCDESDCDRRLYHWWISKIN